MALSNLLEAYLQRHRAEYELEPHALAAASLCVARAARIDEHYLAKSVLLEDEDGPLLAVLPAARRLEIENVRAQLGRRLHFAPEAEAERCFPDCELGAMPALGAAFGLPSVLDRSLEFLEEVYFEAGDHRTLVRMRGVDFLELSGDAARGEIAVESAAWIAARRSRERLYGSILEVSDAITAPAASGPRWHRRLRRALDELRLSLADHTTEAESPDGLLRQIEEKAPHLARSVEILRTEHRALAADCDALRTQLDESLSTAALRSRVLVLLGGFAVHRHRGADLVYEAYEVDIGGG